MVTVRVAERAPMAVGVKVTVTVQVLPWVREVQVLVWVKSAALVPEMAMLVMLTVETKVVVLVTVAVIGAEDAPRSIEPKFMDVGRWRRWWGRAG